MDFFSDAPIRGRAGDRLGRRVLAEHLARALIRWRRDESLVVALHGGWGSGKTSVKNMALESLRRRKTPPTIAEFNPWEISGQPALAGTFFKAVADALRARDGEPAAQVSAERLTAYGKRFDQISDMTSFGLKAVRKLAGVAGVLSIPGATAVAEGARLAEQTMEKLDEARQTLKEGAKLAADGVAAELSLTAQKAELSAQLAKLKQPVIVVIDDMDRLAADEICLLFRLIKSNCDFPRFVFLLLFDRPYVAEALNALAPGRGEEFIEKIVQVPLDVPVPQPEEIAAMLREEVLALLPKRAREAPLFTDLRWSRLVEVCVASFLRHIRDLRRLLNAFQLHLGVFTTRSICEVNPLDLLALETLRLFEPGIYDALPTYRSLLLGQHRRPLPYEQARDTTQEAWQALLALAPAGHCARVDAMLKELFLKGSELGSHWRPSAEISSLQIAHPSMFDVYFHRAVPKRSVSQATVEKTLAAARDPDALLEILSAHLATGQHELLLDHLAARAEHLFPHTEAVCRACIAFGERLIAEDPSWWWLERRHELVELTYACLLQEKDAEQRWEKFRAIVGDASGPRFLLAVAPNEADATRRSAMREDHLLVPAHHAEDFTATVSARLAALLEKALAGGQRDLLELLYRWRDCVGIDAPVQWLRSQLPTAAKTLVVLRAASFPTIWEGVVIHEHAWRPEDMTGLIPLTEWRSAAQQIERSTLSEEERLLMENFDAFLHRAMSVAPAPEAESSPAENAD